MQVARAAVDGLVRYGDVAEGVFKELSSDVFGTPTPTGAEWQLADVCLLSPVDPRRILLVMGGYVPNDGDHVPPGDVPWFFSKDVSNVSGEGGIVIAPDDVDHFWIEPELAIVIGRQIHRASSAEAQAAIFGYTCFNDISAPQFMYDDVATRSRAARLDIFRVKCQDTSASMGPWISTDLTEDDVIAGLQITCRVNGAELGEGNTRRQKFTPSEWVRFAASITTLNPGDVLTLGTPAPCDAHPGDEFEIEIERIGKLAGRIAPRG